MEKKLCSVEAKKLGFTLVEALVSIAIIAILIAILFSVSGRIREQTQAVQCIQNLKQLGQIILTYGAEHQQSLLPGIRYGDPQHSSGSPWYYELNDKGYLPAAEWEHRKASIMRCPARAAAGDTAPSLWFMSLNYGMNFFPGFINGTAPGAPAFRLSKVKNPGRTALVAEVKDQYLMYPWENPHTAYPHRGHVNIVFVDGHVEAVKAPVPAVITSSASPDHIIVDDPFPFF